jgi:ferredoxin
MVVGILAPAGASDAGVVEATGAACNNAERPIGARPSRQGAILPMPARGWRPTSEERMAYVITEPCIGTKDTACVDVCPVDCIHPRKDEPDFEAAKILNIHPDECIDCGACVPACPVEAIFALDEVPEKWKDYIGQNSEYFKK